MVLMLSRNVQTAHCPDINLKRPDGLPKFEKFQNCFLDKKIVDRLDERARDSDSD